MEMETNTNGTTSNQTLCTKARVKSTVNEFHENFTSHLQTLMLEAGFSQSEYNVNSQTFLQFKHVALIRSYNVLIDFKDDISEEDQNYWDWLEEESKDYWYDSKINMALHSYENALLEYLQKNMINVGCKAFKTEESNKQYLSLLFNVLKVETEKLMSNIPSQSDKHIDRKKQRIDEYSPDTSSALFVVIEPSILSIKLVKSTKRHNIYCISTRDGTKALKTTLVDNPTIDDVQNLDNELVIGRQTSNISLRKAYAKTFYQNKTSLILEWVKGEPLSDVDKLAIPKFLTIAREIASCLLAMHFNKMCHLNLSCDHIIFDSESNSIKIIGCGSSSSFCNKQSHNPKLFGKYLRCISPEQTGRVNRYVDYRSDFYSLGIIFYRLLVGKYPFDCENKSKLVKMHLFQDPFRLHEVDPNIPLPLSNMVSKLMEKDVDLRYKSAKGIMHDIDLIISECKPGIDIILAQHDTPETVLLPQKLYGRTNEYSTLLSAYDRALTSSSFELVFVKGKCGCGKTVFVKELNKQVVKKGFFIFGKYDSSKTEPYSALIEAINMFCDVIKLEDETTLAKYRSAIQDAVGEEGRLLTNVVDCLQSIVGKQPESFESFGTEAKNRFNYVFVKFIKAIASISRPLVICLDDLQWADVASLDLLKALVEDSIKNLVLIGIYRDDEIKDGHDLVNFIETVRSMDISTTAIQLNNINHEDINRFLADALDASPFDTYTLTAFIFDKTEGLPLFVKQVVIDLFAKELITYNYEKKKWTWDLSIFKGINFSENVLDLLKQKIKSLDKYTQETLKYASCLGGTFSLSSLRLIVKNKKGVEDALAIGMITRCKGSDTCCFAHNQVKRAAQSLLPNDPKPIYLYVARKLYKGYSTKDLEDNIYTIANLLNLAKEIIKVSERPNVTKLFLLAGNKAMESAAPVQAFDYFKSGIELLDEDDWNTRYEFCIKIHGNAAKMSYWLTNYKHMNKCIEKISKNAKSALDLVTPYLLLIRMCNDKRMFSGALGNASIILEKLGERNDLNKSQSRSQILHTKNLVGESIESILKMKEMDDIKLLSVMEILNSILFSSFLSGNHQVFTSLTLRMIQITMQYGLCKYSCAAFCGFSVVLRDIEDKSSYSFGKLSLKLLEEAKAKEMIPLINLCFFSLISPFYTHLRKSLDPLRSTAIVCIEIGLHHYIASTVAAYSVQSFLCGESLLKLLDELSQFEKVLASKTKMYLSVYQAITNLHDTDIKNPAKLIGDKFDYKECFGKDGAKIDIAQTALIGSIIAFYFYDYNTASQLMEICKPLINYLNKFFKKSIFYFYDGLIKSVLARNAKSKEMFIKAIEEDISILKQFAKNAPENHLSKVNLLEAELAVICEKDSEAKSYYQNAISLSNKNGFVNDEALACERCAVFYLELEQQQDATKMLLKSFNCYKTWGACSKMHHLVRTYPFLTDALNDSSIVSDNCCEIINDVNTVGSVSVLTNSSSDGINTWQEQKRSRLSISK